MKRLITYDDNSYMPLWQTDLKFIQDNLIQSITQLAKTFAFDRDMFIVSGCVLTNENDQYSVTEGLVMIAGELIYVPEQSISSVYAVAPHIVKFEYFNPAGEKQFIQDLASLMRNTWDDNYGKLQAQPDPEPLPGNRLYLNSAKTITNLIIEKAGEQLLTDTGWINLTLINGWAYETLPQYRVVNGVVYLRGDIIDDGSATNYKFAELNTNYGVEIPVSQFCSSGEKVTINENGLYVTNANVDPVLLNGLSWLIG